MDRSKKLRVYLHSINGQLRMLERIDNSTGQGTIDRDTVASVGQELAELEREFPELVPAFQPQLFFSHDVGRGAYYRLAGLILHLKKVIGRLEVATEDDDSAPVTEMRDFTYVSDAGLRKILARDYTDIQKSFISGSWKATMILAGGAIEAILLDQLKLQQAGARAAASAPKSSDLERWDLSDLITVAVELNVVGLGVDKLSHSLREYRNLVHPGNELRSRLTVGREKARIAVEILNIVDRELRP